MKTVGIIAEYNPFHNGHLFHLEQAKNMSGAENCIVAMSGNFVQRGEPACADKYLRAEWAVRGGADAVIEIPSIYAVSSAERFALGSIRTLMSVGVITHVSFGCETSDLSILEELSEILSHEPSGFKDLLHEELKSGKSYPRARFDALKKFGISNEYLDALSKPNNILALEYLRVIKKYYPEIIPVPVQREANNYLETELTGTISSSTAIRSEAFKRNRKILEALPIYVGSSLYYNSTFPVCESKFENLLLYSLREKDLKQLTLLPDVSEGFENVIYKSVRTFSTYKEVLEASKSKRYTMARIKRIAISSLLGITANQFVNSIKNYDSEYLHFLCIGKNKRALLSKISEAATAPIIIRNSDASKCNEIIKANLATDILSTDIYALGCGYLPHKDYEGVLFV